MNPVRVLTYITIAIGLIARTAGAQSRECSPAITNGTCTVKINRESPSSPLPIRLTHDAVVTIDVTKRPLEIITLETTFNDVPEPDPMTAIFSAFFPIFREVTVHASLWGAGPDFQMMRDVDPAALPGASPATPLLRELIWIDARQRTVEPILKDLKSKLDAVGAQFKMFRERLSNEWTTESVATETAALISSIGELSSAVSPVGVIAGLHEALKHATESYAGLALERSLSPTILKELGDRLNDVTANQTQLEASATGLQAAQTALVQAAAILKRIDPSKALRFSQRLSAGSARISRAAIMKVAAVDGISKTFVSLGTVTLTWTSTRWELSLGPLVSSVENRTFQNSPRFVDGQPALDAAGKVNTFITESITRPTVVPFALAHFRLAEGAPRVQRIAFLISGGMGISPYSKSTDFGIGATIAYRSFMVTPLWHLARDVRLTNGLVPGQSLGNSPPAVATERFWVMNRAGLVLSMRIPF